MKKTLIKMLKIVELIERFESDIVRFKKHEQKFRENYPSMANDYLTKIYNKQRAVRLFNERLEILKSEL